jgi:hypothetical protein
MKYTYISTDGSKCDIVTVSKDLLKNCTMRADVFDDLVINFSKENISLTEAYHKAEEVHEHYFGKPRYTDHGSYRASYSYRHNKK